MSATAPLGGGPGTPALPPVALVSTVSLALTVVGGIVMASYIPRDPPLGVPIALCAVATALLAWSAVTVVRLGMAARGPFTTVFRWALLAYCTEMGMLVYVFVHNDVPGGPFAVLCWLLALFAFNVPVIIAFTVARYATPSAV